MLAEGWLIRRPSQDTAKTEKLGILEEDCKKKLIRWVSGLKVSFKSTN